MAARRFLKITPNDLSILADNLHAYAKKCEEASSKLKEAGTEFVITDGYSATVDGIGRLRKFVREFVGEIGLPPDDLAITRDQKVAESNDRKPKSQAILAAEEKLRYHRKNAKKKP